MAVLLNDIVSHINRGYVYGRSGEDVTVVDKSYGRLWIVQKGNNRFFAAAESVSEDKKVAVKENDSPEEPVIQQHTPKRESKKWKTVRKNTTTDQTSLFK